MSQQPLLRRGGLSKTVWCITRYRVDAQGRIHAQEKHDVTEDYQRLVAEGIE